VVAELSVNPKGLQGVLGVLARAPAPGDPASRRLTDTFRRGALRALRSMEAAAAELPGAAARARRLGDGDDGDADAAATGRGARSTPRASPSLMMTRGGAESRRRWMRRRRAAAARGAAAGEPLAALGRSPVCQGGPSPGVQLLHQESGLGGVQVLPPWSGGEGLFYGARPPGPPARALHASRGLPWAYSLWV